MPGASQRRALLALTAWAAREDPDEPLPEAQLAALPEALVRRHFLAPLAYRAGAGRFRRDYIASALMAELRARTLDEVTGAFADAGIELVRIKGIAYLGALYRDPAERPMSDIDLLVPPARHADAARALRRLGYWRVGSPRQHSRLHHAVGYKRRNASVDLHRSMVQPWRSRVDIDALWRRASREPAGPQRLEAVDEAVLHFAHLARHELLAPLVNYIDGARLLRRVARADIAARARDFRLARAVDAALRMTEALTSNARLRPGLGTSPDEVLAYRPIWRPLQIARKALLVDGPAELVGLFAVGCYDGLAHRLRP
ncbi:nucleotidyltransferase family protein [Haliangium ochraceum]|uniref:Nucleotidyltransferase family protein n=1 Tax=Haliangium ochraceum (strain DSM 14365 / JCM 11303 / SMP-2) TaxID=502025 RepID=D0LIS2_HALO1|nr:nucleotidyltransferase family protein [Haliangium ochraceum]ACY12951.1 hypothetical protein Hoch_0310 [Haliangium ochraceum DSM 14365]